MARKVPRRTTARSQPWGIVFGLLIFQCFSFTPSLAQDSGFYPGKLGIAKAKTLSLEERGVEARFAAYLEAQTDGAITRYKTKYGKEINTDNVRELSTDYAPGGMDAIDEATNAARTRWGEAVFQPARALARELYSRALKQNTPPQQRQQVVFTAGGAGVGKTTSIRQLPGLAHAVDAAEITVDTTLSDLHTASERIDQALHAGRMVSIVLIYRDPVDALVKGVFPRAKAIGRIPTLAGFLETHLGSAETLPKVAEKYKDNSRVAIAVIDNSRGVEFASLSDVGFIEKMARKYSREELKVKLLQAAEVFYEKGKKGDPTGITENLYRVFKEHGR